MRLYWDYKEETQKKKYLGTILLGTTFISLFFSFLIVIFQNYFSLVYESIPFNPYIFLGILLSFLTVFLQNTYTIIRLKEKALLYALVSFLQLVFSNVFIFWLLVNEKQGALSYLKGTLYGLISLLPILFVIVFKEVKFKFSFKMFFASLRFCWPINITLLASWVLSSSDRIVIERFLNLADVGIYSLAYKISSLALILGTAFGMAFDPVFFKLANSEKSNQAVSDIKSYNKLFIIALTFTFLIISLSAKELLSIFFTKDYSAASMLVPVFSITFFFSSIVSLVGRYYQQSKKTFITMWIALVFSIFSVIINVAFIYFWGLIGITVSSAITSFLMALAIYYYSKKLTFFVPLSIIKTSVIFILFMLLVIVIDNVILADFNLIRYVIKIVILGIIGYFFMKKYYFKIKMLILKK